MTRLRSRRSSFAQPMTKALDWDIQLKPVCVQNTEVPNYQSIVRTDNEKVLALTKKSYHPATNEKFVEVVGRIYEFTGFEVEGYSVFQDGRKVLAYLKNKEKMRIGDFDSENYMVIGNSFDCTTGFFTGISNVVLRCTNQFSRMNIGKSVRHDSQINLKLDELVRFYKDFMLQENELKTILESWNRAEASDHLVKEFVDVVLDIPQETVGAVKLNQRESLFNSINTEIQQMGSSAYGLFNGLTHYTSHVARTSHKMFGNPLGHSYKLNERGFKFLKNAIR